MKGFLKTAHDYITKDAAVPSSFGYWAAHTTLAHILGCSAWTNYGGHRDIFAKWMVIFVGRPSAYKSMTLKWADEFVSHLNLPRLPRKVSAAKLFQRIERIRMDETYEESTINGPYGKRLSWCNVLFQNGEMSESFELAGNDLINQFNALFDFEQTTYDTCGQGDHTIEPLHFNLMWGCQPQWAKKLSKDVLFDGGFMRRVVIAYPDVIPFFKPGDRDPALLARGRTEIEYIRDHPSYGAVSWAADAEKVYDKFVIDHIQRVQKLQDNKLITLWSDHHVFVARLCLGLAISARPDKPTIEMGELDEALAIIAQVQGDEEKLLVEGGVSAAHTLYIAMGLYIKQKGCVASDQLFRIFGRDVDPLAYRFAVSELQKASFIKYTKEGFYEWKGEAEAPID